MIPVDKIVHIPNLKINEEAKARLERQATPVHIKIEPVPANDEQIELLKTEFQRVLMEALEHGEKIPYTDEGCATAQRMFMEAYERVVGKDCTITVTLEP